MVYDGAGMLMASYEAEEDSMPDSLSDDGVLKLTKTWTNSISHAMF